MQRRNHARIAGLFVITILAAACGGGNEGGSPATTGPSGDPQAGGELVVGKSQPIDGLKGDQCFGDGSLVLNPIIYDSLLRIAPDGLGTVGGLAESVDYDEDALTYTWHLRPDLKFSDGSGLTTADVAFSIEQWQAGTTFGSYYDMIESVEVVDDQTLITHLSRPDTFLPALITWCSSTVYPEDFGGVSEDEYFEAPASAGPFHVESWTNPGPSETIRLVRNDFYWQPGKPYLDAITIRVSADPGQRVLALENGELDIVEGLDAVGVGDLPDENVQFVDPTAAEGLLVNGARPGLSDVRVRQAISMAIDREGIVAALDGLGQPAEGMLPINVPGSASGDEPYVYDPDQASELLAEAGVDGLTVELAYDGGNGNEAIIAPILQQQFEEIGISLELVPTDSATVVGQMSSGEFDIAISTASVISPTVFDPASFISAALYPWAGADNTVIAEQFSIGVRSADPDVQRAAAVAIENDAATQANYIGMYYSTPAYGVSSSVHDFAPTVYRIWYPDDISKS